MLVGFFILRNSSCYNSRCYVARNQLLFCVFPWKLINECGVFCGSGCRMLAPETKLRNSLALVPITESKIVWTLSALTHVYLRATFIKRRLDPILNFRSIRVYTRIIHQPIPIIFMHFRHLLAIVLLLLPILRIGLVHSPGVLLVLRIQNVARVCLVIWRSDCKWCHILVAPFLNKPFVVRNRGLLMIVGIGFNAV